MLENVCNDCMMLMNAFLPQLLPQPLSLFQFACFYPSPPPQTFAQNKRFEEVHDSEFTHSLLTAWKPWNINIDLWKWILLDFTEWNVWWVFGLNPLGWTEMFWRLYKHSISYNSFWCTICVYPVRWGLKKRKYKSNSGSVLGIMGIFKDS